MALVTDFLLLAASGAACFYCWALGRRIKSLTRTKDGLGAGIVALSKSAEEMKSALSATKTSADEANTRIEELLSQADLKVAELQKLIEQFSAMSEAVVDQTDAATKSYLDILTPFISEANDVANKLFESIESARAATPAAEAITPEKNAIEQPSEQEIDIPRAQDDQPAVDLAAEPEAIEDGDDDFVVELDDMDDDPVAENVKELRQQMKKRAVGA